MFSYTLTNLTTNELVVSRWLLKPTIDQMIAIRKAFSWFDDDILILSGFGAKFEFIDDKQLIYHGKSFYPMFIEDRSYSIEFIENDITTSQARCRCNSIRLLDNINDILDIVSM